VLIGFDLALVISLSEIFTKITKAVQLLLLVNSMIFHEVTFCGHAYPKTLVVHQNAVAEHDAFFNNLRGQVESFLP
jgi:hypothetical protein